MCPQSPALRPEVMGYPKCEESRMCCEAESTQCSLELLLHIARLLLSVLALLGDLLQPGSHRFTLPILLRNLWLRSAQPSDKTMDSQQRSAQQSSGDLHTHPSDKIMDSQQSSGPFK